MPLKPFDYERDFASIDFRQHPEQYQVGKGEQGVLMVEPYKSEIHPDWRFKTPEIARESSEAIYALFLQYKAQNDFVGMDMARKFVQMGFTRARRYANHKSGRKYDESGRVAPRSRDAEKERAANVFYRLWRKLEADAVYRRARTSWPPVKVAARH